jgi:hypothetical protein
VSTATLDRPAVAPPAHAKGQTRVARSASQREPRKASSKALARNGRAQPLPGRCVRVKNDGTPCKLRPVLGATVCHKHGGKARHIKDKGAARVAIERLGIGTGRLQMGPAEALLDALWSACADVALYDRLLAEHEAGGGELYQALYHLTGTATGEAARHILVTMRESARRDQALFARECLKAKVAEARVQLAQEMGAQVGEVLRHVCTALGHSPADPRVRAVMREGLTLMAGSA